MNCRVVIVGFMGSGKTTVADTLARRLGCDSLDLDSFIIERDGRSPAEIIEQDGEAAFRKIETQALRDVLKRSEARVIALGGGAWAVEGNRNLVAEHDCLSVWLDAPFELCWERIVTSANTIRPLAPDRQSALRLYNSRRSSYASANIQIAANKKTPETSATEIQRWLSKEG